MRVFAAAIATLLLAAPACSRDTESASCIEIELDRSATPAHRRPPSIDGSNASRRSLRFRRSHARTTSDVFAVSFARLDTPLRRRKPLKRGHIASQEEC
jgi:hypothetical protein